MVVEQNPNHIWSIVQVHLPSRNVRAMIIGAVVGAASMSSVYFAQVAFDSNKEHRSLWGLFFIGAAFGALIGGIGSRHRKRNCPKCGLCMGVSQNIILGGWDRASPANRLNLREWVERRTTRNRSYNKDCIEPFYLCRSCDLEFRIADLERREATYGAASTQSAQSTRRSRDKPVALENGPSDRAEKSESSTPKGLQIELETDRLTIIRKESRLSWLVGLIAFFGTAALIVLYIDSPPNVFYFLPSLVAASLLASLTDKILNERRIISVCQGQLSVKHAPVPWPGKTISIHDVRQIYCAEHYHFGSKNTPDYYTYDVKLLTTGGRRHKLAAKFRDKQSAHAIEKQIEGILGIEHQDVDSTTVEAYKASASFARLAVPGIFVLAGIFVLVVVVRNYSTNQETASTTSEQSDARSTAAYIAGVKAQVAFDELRGSRWIQSQDRPLDLPDDELVVEFRSDDTGSIQVVSGRKTLLVTEMIYQVTQSGRGEEILISFPNRSEIRARVAIFSDATAMKLHSPLASGWPASLLGEYFQWHLPFERDQEFVESSSEPTQASDIGPTSTEPAGGEVQAEINDSEPEPQFDFFKGPVEQPAVPAADDLFGTPPVRFR